MTYLTFKSLKIRAVDIPLERPIVASLGTFKTWPYLCVDVFTEEGIVGRSYIGPYLKNYLPSIASCMEVMCKSFVGKTIQPYTFFQDTMNSLSLLGYKGIALYALAGLDIALWDAFSKASNKPFADFLGGSIAPIKAYNSSGLWLIDHNKIAKEAELLRKEGDFNALKLRIGRESFKQDVLAFEEVKRGAGSDILIMSDFNMRFTTKEAIRRCTELDDLGFFWFEEPIQYNLLDDMKKICDLIKTPIIIGENFHGPRDAHDSLLRGACDMIMPDLMRIGGVSGWLKTASIAESFNSEVSTHLYPEVSAHLMCLTPSAEWLEWVDWQNPILKNPYLVSDGNIIIPDKPGFGIEWNEDVLDKFNLDINVK